jgi:hypothetical protein
MLRMLLTALLVLHWPIFTKAQTAVKTAEALSKAPRVSQPLPFKTGEVLTYEVTFSKLIFSGTIGELKLWVGNENSKEKSSLGPDMIELHAEAVSKGFFSKLFGVKVVDRFRSVVNPADFGVHTFTRNIEEGKVRREQKSEIDRTAGRVTYTDRDLANTTAKPTVKEAASPAWIQDLLSAIYYLRLANFKEGNVIPVPISDGGVVYNVELVVLGKRDEITVDAGKFKTVLVDARIFDGRYIKRSGEMKLWVSDDPRHIPVRAKVKTSGVTITIALKKLQEREQQPRP